MFEGINLNDLMGKAREVQKQMEEEKEKSAKKVYSVSVGSDAVKMEMNGNLEILNVKIDKEVIDPEKSQLLEELILSAVAEVIRQAKQANTMDINKMFSGINLGDTPFSKE